MLRVQGKLIAAILAFIGLCDAIYLTYEHFSHRIVPCADTWIVDCGKVLNSEYSIIFGMPLAVWGVLFYGALFLLLVFSNHTRVQPLIFLASSVGFIGSVYFMYLQLYVIGALCLYCSMSAFVCFLNFFVIRYAFWKEYKRYILFFLYLGYKPLKAVFFLFDAELVHTVMTSVGEFLGTVTGIHPILRLIFKTKYKSLQQDIAGMHFEGPFGLSAGFDYEAKLTRILEPLGFGFQTIGTITNLPCPGNAKPRLSRLPKSQSLLVNKGFRNPGMDATIHKLGTFAFSIPLGVSIGRTNIQTINTTQKAIDDIVAAFQKWEKSGIGNAFYELNISCPNLQGNISFYEVKNLQKLLAAVFNIQVRKPIFIKMPIELDNSPFAQLLKVILSFPVAGIIVGNLQKKRTIAELNQDEVRQIGKGNFSGKATWNRSNELISLAYKIAGKKIIIIGCGGVFTVQDAYEKIARGASLVQLITGMIFNGPQLIAQMNADLDDLIKRNGYSHISEVVGTA